MSKCTICGKEIPPKGYNHSSMCIICYKQTEKSLQSQHSTEEEYRRRQQHFGYVNLNEDMPPRGFGNMSD